MTTDRRILRVSSGRILAVVLVYACFAALWIFLSDQVVRRLFSDPFRITLASTIKGWAFVAVTAALLYALLRRLTAPGDAPDPVPSPEAGRQLLLPLGLLTAAIVALTAGGIVERHRRQREMEGARLQVIADLKARQVADWLGERERDVRFVATSRFFAETWLRWRAGERDMLALLKRRLDDFREANGFLGVALLDEGAFIWNSQGRPDLEPVLREAVGEAVAERRERRFGPHRDREGRLHLDFIAPLWEAGVRPPAVVFHADPGASLFPLLQELLAPSATGEVLLFQRDGDQVIFLNPLRHLPDAALRLRLPVAGSELLAARALRGEPLGAGAVEAVDYRGVPVLGVVRAVPGTDWFLVAKLDRAEVAAAALGDEIWIGAAGLLALGIALGGGFLFLQRRQFALAQREREAQAERLQALKLLEAISEASNDAIFAKDLEGRYLLFNREAARVTGKRPEEVLGRDDRALFPPDEAELLMELGRRVAAENRAATNEEVLTTADGVRTFLATKGPLHDAAGRVVGIYGISRDITARKEGERALRENEAFTRAVLDHLPVGIAVNSVDPTVVFSYMNDNFPRFYRTTRERLADPDAFWDAVYEDPAFRRQIRERVLADCASGDPARMLWEEVPITRAGAETRYVTARNTPVPGGPLMISTVWDVTERKRAEEERARLEAQLLQAQKMESIGRLAGGVAHDFNNQLLVILGHAGLALDRAGLTEPVRASLEEIRRAGARSATLTQQLLAFARRQAVAPRVLDLNATVAGMLSMLRRLIGEDIDLVWRPNEGLWPVRIDPTQVDQVLANLCVNARDAIAGVGKITIETDNRTFDAGYCADHPGFLPGEYALLAVSDDGCGMSREVQEHLFEPFYTTKEPGKGTGLGLATVYGIVRQNEGFIHVSSEPGKGSTFRIYFRRSAAAPAAAAEEEAAAPAPPGRGELILLVEDEEPVRRLGAEMLVRLGYEVLSAATPEEALRIARERDGAIRLLLTDVVMPGMNGRDLARRLAGDCPGMACLFMSGYTANAFARHGVLEEDVRFIPKPFSERELGWQVHAALAAGAAASAAGRGAQLRMLLVDDDLPLLELVRRHLRRRGWQVEGYADPAAALAAFRLEPGAFDCVVTDLSMPGMSGFDLARRIRALRPDVPVVVTTGCVKPEDEARARTLGARALLQKPETVEELAAAVDRALCDGGGPGGAGT